MGASDLGIIFPVIIFISLIIFLSGFFVVDNSVFSLKENTVDHNSLPYNKIYVGNNNSTAVSEENNEVWGWILSGIFVAAAAVTAVLVPPVGVPLLIVGIGMSALNIPALRDTVMDKVPLIKSLAGGVNYVATALSSFGDLAAWSPDWSGGFPVFGVLILGPLTIFFFVFILRFIRGQ